MTSLRLPTLVACVLAAGAAFSQRASDAQPSASEAKVRPASRPASSEQADPAAVARIAADVARLRAARVDAADRPAGFSKEAITTLAAEPPRQLVVGGASKDRSASLPAMPAQRRLGNDDLFHVDAYAPISGATLAELDAASAVQLQLSTLALPLDDASTELRHVGDLTDDIGVRHIRLQQTFEGVPVYGAEVILHQPPTGTPTATGSVRPTPKKAATMPAFGVEEAADQMLAHYPAQVGDDIAGMTLPATEPELYLYPHDGRLRLAYVANVSPRWHQQYRVVLDALSGAVIDEWSLVCRAAGHGHVVGDDAQVAAAPPSGPEQATATDLNGVSRQLNVFSSQGTYWMVDAARPMWQNSSAVPSDIRGGLVVLDAMNNQPEDGKWNLRYVNDQQNQWRDPSAVSAAYNAGRSYEYFRTVHGRNSIDGQGGSVLSIVNVPDSDTGAPMDNAYWSNKIMWYGNGDFIFSPIAGGLDVGAHEMSHGVIENTANLEYRDEPGALNEHFADVFAAMVDRDDWTLGEEVVKGYYPTGNMRDMADPANGGRSLSDPGYQPPTYSQRYLGDRDNGGVHINSGIPNNVCYRIATAIGREKTERLYYDVLSNYLGRNSTFRDYRAGMQQRAAQLFGANSNEVAVVVAALDAVGIPGGGNTGGGNGGGGNPPPQQETNPGTALIAYLDADEDAMPVVTEAGAPLIDDITPSHYPLTRASVSDDGSVVMMVTECCLDGSRGGDINFVSIDYATNTVTEEIVPGDVDGDGVGDIRNVVLSRDGSRFALLLDGDYRDDKIYVADIATGESKDFRLYTPTTQEQRNYTVQYADAMEFDYTGEYILYDALNAFSVANGEEIEAWDIGFVEVFDAERGTFADGDVTKLFGALEPGVNIGNPTLSKNSAEILAFDYFNPEEDVYAVIGYNYLTGEQSQVWGGSKLGWPTFTSDDEHLVFSANTTDGDDVLGILPLAANKISRGGDASGLVGDASRGTAYANGQRELVNLLEQLDGGTDWMVAPNPTADIVRIFRHADAAVQTDGFEVIDVTGRSVLTAPADALEIDLTVLPKGSYVIRQGGVSRTVVRN